MQTGISIIPCRIWFFLTTLPGSGTYSGSPFSPPSGHPAHRVFLNQVYSGILYNRSGVSVAVTEQQERLLFTPGKIIFGPLRNIRGDLVPVTRAVIFCNVDGILYDEKEPADVGRVVVP